MSELIQHGDIPITILPFELLEAIVHNLDNRNDLSALIACTYANRTLHDLAQKELFHTISFSYRIALQNRAHRTYCFYEDENSNFKVPALHRVFKEFPQLLDNVRESSFLFTQLSLGESITVTNRTRADMKEVLPLLLRMKNLRHISFPGSGSNVSAGTCLHWEAVPLPLMTFFFDFFESKSPTSLDLRGILNFPTRILPHFPSIQSLAWLTPAAQKLGTDADAGVGGSSRISLRALELSTANEMHRRRRREYGSRWKQTLRWLQGPTCVLNLENLRSLAMPVFSPPEGADLDDAGQIFALCYASLETLTFRTLHNVHQRHRLIGVDTNLVDHYITQPPDLSGLHRLSSLSIYTSIAGSNQPGLFKNPIPWVMDLLKTLSRAPCFANHYRKLCLHLELHNFPQVQLRRAGLLEVQGFLKEQSEGRPSKTLDVMFYSVDERGLRERISLERVVWEGLFL